MKFRFSNWTPSLVLVSALAATACGDDGGKTTGPSTPEDGGDTTSSADGGKPPPTATTAKPGTSASTTARPGASNGADTGVETDGATVGDGGGPGPVGDGSTPPEGDGSVTPPPPSGDLDDLIGAICAWEFRCCDDGERAFRFGPSIADAAACKTRFVEELREKNSSNNPFVSGSAAGGLLSALAYSINLDRVEVNADAVAECTAQMQDMDCYSKAPTVAARCTAASATAESPCALDQLFKPTLSQGDDCTPALGQAKIATNDIECKPGTSCLAADDPENTTGSAACISRGLIDDSCSQDSDCDFGFYCDDASGCQPKSDEGEDCTYDDDDGSGVHPSSCKPGLSCDPESSKCVSYCSAGFECFSNAECPDDYSCIPAFDGEGEPFHLCLPVGSGATADCDDTADCVAGQYCADGSCAGQRDSEEDCVSGVLDQCVKGTYCDGYQCKTFNKPTEICAPGADPALAPECDPTKSVGCIQKFDSDPDPASEGEEPGLAYKCRAAKNKNGEDCTIDFECASGKCEVVADQEVGHTTRVCTAGANAGADCDANPDDKDALSCKPGTFCNPDGKCQAQLPPGSDCEDVDVSGTGNPVLCANSTCAEQWSSFLCTDLAIPESAGGTGVACDGNE